MSYNQLQADVLALSIRDDLSAQIPTFVRLAETRMWRKLRIRAMEVSEQLTMSGSVASNLPTGWRGFRSVSYDYANQRSITLTSPNELRSSIERDDSSSPAVYAIEGDTILVAPIPAVGTFLWVTYYKALTALSDTNPTNWIETNAYDLYLYGTMRALFEYLEDDAREDRYETKFQTVIEELNREQKLASFATGAKRLPNNIV